MHIQLIFVGKTAHKELAASIEHYLDRLRHYTRVSVHTVRAEKVSRSIPEHKVLEAEGERIVKLMGSEGRLLVWDRTGRQMDSLSFAGLLESLQNRAAGDLWMATGGPLGLSPKIIARADWNLSFSAMTLSHDLFRVVLLEQLYRAFTILRGEPYHK